MPLRSQNLSRNELIELGRLCNMPGAQGGFRSPYRNRDWICANLPLHTGNKKHRTRRNQRGGQEPMVGQYVPMPSPLSSLSQLPPPLTTTNFPKRKLHYCPGDPPTQALEIDEDDPRFLEYDALFRSLPTFPTIPTPTETESIYQTLPLSPIGTGDQPIPLFSTGPSRTGTKELSPGAKATQAAINSGSTGVTSEGLASVADEIVRRAAELVPSEPVVPTLTPIVEGSQYGFIPGMGRETVPGAPGIPSTSTVPMITMEQILGPPPPIPSKPKPRPKPRAAKKKPLPERPAKRTSCPSGYNLDETSGMCLQVAKTCPDIEVCKAELESLGMREKDIQQLLDQVKSDLLACQSSSKGWKEIQNDLQSLNLTKEEADRIMVSVGKNLVARIKAGENLDSLLDRIQRTLDEGAVQVALATEAGISLADVPTLVAPIAPPPLPIRGIRSRIPSSLGTVPSLTGSTGSTGIGSTSPRPSAEQLQGIVLRKVTPVEREETRQKLESTIQGALLSNPAFLARRKALQESQSGITSTADWD